ncbi:sugar ABC transporter substrate-binding protein [Desulfococcaceae bacterium HSG8]|nr:sugar ABC transporter substrate-binding protein [Desulfococcaceae bacterium HSG8]
MNGMMKMVMAGVVIFALMSSVAYVEAKDSAQTYIKTDKSPKDIVIGMIPITLEAGYHRAEAKNAIAYAKEKYGVTVIVTDGEHVNQKAVVGVENFLSKSVDGILLHAGDGNILDACIRKAHARKVPILTFYNEPYVKIAPHIQVQESKTSYQMGAEAVRKWKEFHPGKPIRVGIIEYLNIEHVQKMRSRPFIKGVMAADPGAEIVALEDGEGSTERAMAIMRNMIRSHPEINIVYGTNANHAMGALAALETLGRGKAVNGIPQTEIVIGTDANVEELIKLYDPKSSFKITQGQKAVTNSVAKIDTMMKMLNGEMPINQWIEVETFNEFISYWDEKTGKAEWGQKWLKEQFLSDTDLAKEVGLK